MLRQKNSTVPIIAATASNKTWTLESLLKHGINAYWVKESPDTSKKERDSILSTVDLVQKLCSVLHWNRTTRRRLDKAFKIARLILPSDPEVGQGVQEKAHLLTAHEFRGVDRSRSNVDRQLHLDVSYLMTYSLINEIYSWVLKESSDKDQGQIVTPKAATLPLYEPSEKKDGFVKLTKTAAKLNKESWHGHKIWEQGKFQESMFFDIFLRWLGFRDSADTYFLELRELRNRLPFVHGRMCSVEDKTFKHASKEDVDGLMEILNQLVVKAVSVQHNYVFRSS